jgi:serine/threonine protein kinase
MLCSTARGARIKLIDFGVAKVEREARRLVGPIVFPTREGTCLGTPRYVSPEQASGLDVDRRTDIYAAGMLLYTLIAGRGPFDDIVGVQRVLAAHIGQEPPPPSRFAAEPLAASIEAVILRAIAKNPDERFADAATFRRELARAWARERGSRRRPPRAERRSGKHDALTFPSDRRTAGYARRPAVDRCRLRSSAESAVRSAYVGQRRTAMTPVSSRVAVRAADTDTVTVLWSGIPQPVSPESVVTDESPRGAESDDGPAAHSRRKASFAAPVSRRGVVCSAAAFFAVAGGLAMWFVR